METYKQESESVYAFVNSRTYIQIDLDTISRNVAILKGMSDTDTEIIAVVKCNAYGHGAVGVSRHLAANGINHFGVGTLLDGLELREAGITDFIQVFGSAYEEQMALALEYNLTLTMCTVETLTSWADHLRAYTTSCCNRRPATVQQGCRFGQVVIKVDTGMSRFGCQPGELEELMKVCKEEQIPVHSIMTHFARSSDDDVMTKAQLDLFMDVAAKYRAEGVKLHAANTGAILNGFATDLDFIRPGVGIYGSLDKTDQACVDTYRRLGLKSALTWRAKASLLKTMAAGRVVGYGAKYMCEEGDVIATLPVGHWDGVDMRLSGATMLTTVNGDPVTIVGKVSAEAITVRLSEDKGCDEFYILHDDPDSSASPFRIALHCGVGAEHLLFQLSPRVPRVYTTAGRMFKYCPLPASSHLDSSD